MQSTTFDEFFLTEFPRLVSMLTAWSGDRSVAEDLAQDALLQAHRDWAAVVVLERPDAWVRRVALNRSSNEQRGRRRERAAVSRMQSRAPAEVVIPTADDRLHDPAESALSAAGRRLRQQAPDEVAARQALARVRHRAETPPPERRSWWPALIGAGLAATALVAVIAVRADDPETLTPATAPEQTTEVESEPTDPPSTLEPTTTPVPSTTGPGPTGAALVADGGCITLTTAAGSATGCPLVDSQLDHLDQRIFCCRPRRPGHRHVRYRRPVRRSIRHHRHRQLRIEVPVGRPRGAHCRRRTRRGRGLQRHRRDGGNDRPHLRATAGDLLLHASDALPARRRRARAWHTDRRSPTSGRIHRPASRRRHHVQPPVVPDRSVWKEACGSIHGLDLTTSLVQLDPAAPELHEISVDSVGLITSARRLDTMAPSSGCSIDSASDFVRAVPASNIVMGIGCIDAEASLTTGSVLTQHGPPDGSIWLALRADDVWTITDNGTGIEAQFSFPIAASSTWTTWPESTVPGFRSYLWEPIVAIDTQPDVDALADEVLAILGNLGGDPEFPPNERLVAVQPDGLPLIAAQIDIGGDDSAAGSVIYVWLDEQFDDSGPIGWRAGVVLSGEVCARGETAGRELCI